MSVFVQRLSRMEVTYTFPARFETICIDLTPGGDNPYNCLQGELCRKGYPFEASRM